MLRVFKNKGEAGAIPLNAENLNYNFNEILNLVYPIGRGFIDFTDTDYSNYLGFTWERELVGMTAVGLDTTQTEFNSVGKIGGEKKHTLKVSEMPEHNHFIYSQGGDVVTGDGWVPKSINGKDVTQVMEETIVNTGGNQPHNNLQPYKVVSYWKRIL